MALLKLTSNENEMKNNNKIIPLFESNITAKRVDMALSSTAGLFYDKESEKCRRMVKEGVDRVLNAARAKVAA
jgi:hypothetical protein